ncbi:helix-turn-helix domain-containing protein [Prevotella sp. 10(H)]|uniref:helix-turn-helix domain-containing protein n=1 Tax=Prevotella sp. 10(H) TaxID=1158294 RepID=UPI0004A6E2DF|nr:helix-turn-helix domain-containing protein [Prevotella sp. 10(H)]
MKNDFNKKIVTILNSYFPQTKELAHYLMDILDLSRESAYRRLRSEVPFTFEEVCTVALDLDLSVDKLIGMKNNDIAYFVLKMYNATEPDDIYLEIIQDNIDLMEKFGKNANFKMLSVLNRLPFGFTLRYPELAKFYYYKFCFHLKNGTMDEDFSSLQVPKKIEECVQRYMKVSDSMRGDMTMIMDENVFTYMLKEIDYFKRRGLINGEGLAKLRDALMEIVDLMEALAKKATNTVGADIKLYLSSIDVEPSYVYTEYGDKTAIQFYSPSAEAATCYNPKFCARKKEWIDSLIRYTTLITQCNEMEQISFFNNQRNLIREMAEVKVAGANVKEEILFYKITE